MAPHDSLVDAVRAVSYESLLNLLKAGADPNEVCGMRRPLLQAVFQKKHCVEMINLLLEYGAKPDFAIFKSSLLRSSAKTVKTLIKYGADPNGHNPGDCSALHILCFSNNPDQRNICKTLIELGADVNCENDWYDTPLFCAVNTRNEELIEALLKYGARPCYNCHNRSPLVHSFGRVSEDIVLLMIKYAALQVNHRNERDVKAFFRNFGNKITQNDQKIPGKQYRNFVKDCMKEIEILKNKLFKNKNTLFDFVYSEGSAIALQSDTENLQYVVDNLPSFPLYKELLLERIDHKYIHSKLLSLSHSIYWNSNKKVKPIVLDMFSLEHILQYLTKIEICNFYIAVSLAN